MLVGFLEHTRLFRMFNLPQLEPMRSAAFALGPSDKELAINNKVS